MFALRISLRWQRVIVGELANKIEKINDLEYA